MIDIDVNDAFLIMRSIETELKKPRLSKKDNSNLMRLYALFSGVVLKGV